MPEMAFQPRRRALRASSTTTMSRPSAVPRMAGNAARGAVTSSPAPTGRCDTDALPWRVSYPPQNITGTEVGGGEEQPVATVVPVEQR